MFSAKNLRGVISCCFLEPNLYLEMWYLQIDKKASKAVNVKNDRVNYIHEITAKGFIAF